MNGLSRAMNGCINKEEKRGGSKQQRALRAIYRIIETPALICIDDERVSMRSRQLERGCEPCLASPIPAEVKRE